MQFRCYSEFPFCFKDVYIRGWVSPIYYLSAEMELEAIKQSLYLSAVKQKCPFTTKEKILGQTGMEKSVSTVRISVGPKQVACLQTIF